MTAEQQPSDLLARYIAHWQLRRDAAPFHTASSVLQAVRWRGQPAMLKIALTEEEIRGNQWMAWRDGRGAAAVLGLHGPALLMARLLPEPSLPLMSQQGQDDQATRVLCRVARELHRPGAEPLPVLMPLSQWFQDLLQYQAGGEVALRQAAGLAASLLSSQQEVTLLHGDLHHGNVMQGVGGWCAIDPKGLYGERGFDYANLFCNPCLDVVLQPGRLERLLALVCEEAGLVPQRLLGWIAAWSGLSVLWHRQDGGDERAARHVLEQALAALRLA
ncbi:aminoglycoside phosphotransferase family protein [Paludibacterium sp. THUN1379]|uniref:aminoglycoside phosphotransferase family protein n=1 Tax=Paludibacterium sp. THUN1379 TaxID=3112107 RepID=UPI00308796CF|nr:aminoglycoside phosphotransferase family protein [Paludibacterium sp. THUN1379]